MKYILAIDQGTTGSRAIVFDKQGKAIASAYHEFPQYFPQPGWVEHDPLEIWESVTKSIKKVMTKVTPASISAIGITNQRETVVVWDRKSGKPIYNGIVWQCRRTAKRCDLLKKNVQKVKEIKDKTGLPVDAYFSGTKVEWILKHVKGSRVKARRGELCFGTIDSWILWNLTGGKVHATDYTNASRTQLFNIKKLSWDDSLLQEFHVPKVMLPEVKQSSALFGETVKLGKLLAGIPISGIAGDQQAALFGQTCFEPGSIKNTYGTGSFILLNTGKQKVSSNNGLITTIACDKTGAPVYALEGSVFIAGAAIQWLRDQLQIIDDAKASEKVATSVSDNGGVYFVPAFVGLGAPYWDQDARGMISGLTRGSSRAHIVRAALEAMCYQTKDVLLAMERDSKLKISSLKVDGGAVANNFLCQYQADILGVNVIRPKVVETTALGVAYLAGLSSGYWKSSDDIKKCWKQEREFKPLLKRIQANGFYLIWQKAVKRASI